MNNEDFSILDYAISLSLHKVLADSCPPIPTELPVESIIKAGRTLHPGVILPLGWVKDLMENMGGKIKESQDEFEDCPLMVADSPSRFLIFMPPASVMSNRGEDWFIALSIAHMQLHWPPRGGWGARAKILYVSRAPQDLTQKKAREEATIFALELLLPEPLFVNNFIEAGLNQTVKNMPLNIADNLFKFRAKNLGLIK